MIFLFKGDNKDVIPNIKRKPNIVYLDPPYNTKNENLSYNDHFGDDKDEIWFNEFFTRLELIKKIIQKQAVIYVSIGHEELANAKIALDKVFGKKNFSAILPRATGKTSKTTNTISRINDFVVVYALGGIKFNQTDIRHDSYDKIDEFIDERGKYFLRRLDYKDFKYSKTLDFEIIHDEKKFYPSSNKTQFELRKKNHLVKDWCWIWSKEKVHFALKNDFLVFNGNKVFKKTYTNCKIVREDNQYKLVFGKRGQPFSSLELTDNNYWNKKDESSLEKLFSYPKSRELIKFLFQLPQLDKKIILDAYAGSGISGIVADKLSLDCLLIQKSEPVKPNDVIAKSGFSDIFDLTKAILEENKVKFKIIEKTEEENNDK